MPIEIDGDIAFTQYSPWIRNQTIRDNITYNLPFDMTKYIEAIQLSELEKDLKFFKAGDQTEIGEQGINLTGG